MNGQADVLFINARVVDVFTGRIIQREVAVKDGFFQGFGPYPAQKTVDLENRYMVPGLLDAHVHIESSMVPPARFAKAVLACGTTTCIADPHEIANVAGLDGIRYMIDAAEDQLLNICFALPSCVPATHMETAGAAITAKDMEEIIHHPRIAALGEMMNFPGVIHQDPEILSRIDLALRARKPVDGHAPGLTGEDLHAYVRAGISTDHECTRPEEAKEKLECGMHIMIREGTCAKNLDDLFPVIDEHTARRMMWCTDDRHPEEILTQGHVDHIIRRAVAKGLDPVRAIQMGTITCADHYRLHDAGAVAPGRRADFIVTDSLEDFRPGEVYANGILAARNGVYCADDSEASSSPSLEVMHLDGRDIDLEIPAQPGKVRVIEVISDQVVTQNTLLPPSVQNGLAVADPERDMAKIAVIERYAGKAGTGIGFVRGLGLSKGALASSVAHDSHNIVTAGTNDRDMHKAVRKVVEMKGGFAVALDGEILQTLPLEIAGLMTDLPVKEVEERMKSVIRAARSLGCPLSDPFMALGFLALPVIPELKITDKGLVDVNRFQIVDLFVKEQNQ
ncbi:MAG: adenine deaminase [Desulfarculaceae bacterium]|nr:adenine deaminase [Desulfarculaceae bacterium]